MDSTIEMSESWATSSTEALSKSIAPAKRCTMPQASSVSTSTFIARRFVDAWSAAASRTDSLRPEATSSLARSVAFSSSCSSNARISSSTVSADCPGSTAIIADCAVRYGTWRCLRQPASYSSWRKVQGIPLCFRVEPNEVELAASDGQHETLHHRALAADMTANDTSSQINRKRSPVNASYILEQPQNRRYVFAI